MRALHRKHWDTSPPFRFKPKTRRSQEWRETMG